MPALKVTIGGDAMPFIQEMKKMEAVAMATGQSVSRSLTSTISNPTAPPASAQSNYVNWWKKNIDTSSASIKAYYERKKASGGVNVYAPTGFGEFLKKEAAVAGAAGAEIGKSTKKGFLAALQGSSSASSQLISVVSNTLSSLGSGMSPAKVLMQQGPNFAQAFTLMGQSARALLMSLLPIAGTLAGIAAVGYGIYRVYRYFADLAQVAKEAARPFGLARTTIAQLNDEMNRGAEMASRYRQWLHSLGGETLSVAQKTDLLLKKMREKFRLESEIAKSRGSSPQSLLQMELAQLQAELKVINTGIETAYAKRQQHLDAAAAAEKALEGNAENRSKASQAAEKNKLYAKIATEIENKLGITELMDGKFDPNELITKGRYAQNLADPGAPGIWETYTVTKAEELARLQNEEIEVTVDGVKQRKMSLARARLEMLTSAQLKTQLDKTEEELARLLAQKQELTKSDVESIRALHKQESDIQETLNLKQKYGPELGGGTAPRQPLTSREQIGAFAGGAGGVSLLDVARKQHSEAQKHTRVLGDILTEIRNGI